MWDDLILSFCASVLRKSSSRLSEAFLKMKLREDEVGWETIVGVSKENR